jgi:hypothetical protein
VTLEELEGALPNGFHDAEIFSFELDYVAGIAKFHMNLLVGWPDDPEPESQAYQEATLVVEGLCFCSIDPPLLNVSLSSERKTDSGDRGQGKGRCSAFRAGLNCKASCWKLVLLLLC